jgi:hypothetical protein
MENARVIEDNPSSHNGLAMISKKKFGRVSATGPRSGRPRPPEKTTVAPGRGKSRNSGKNGNTGISQRPGAPVGEIQLILSLRRQMSDDGTHTAKEPGEGRTP